MPHVDMVDPTHKFTACVRIWMHGIVPEPKDTLSLSCGTLQVAIMWHEFSNVQTFEPLSGTTRVPVPEYPGTGLQYYENSSTRSEEKPVVSCRGATDTSPRPTSGTRAAARRAVGGLRSPLRFLPRAPYQCTCQACARVHVALLRAQVAELAVVLPLAQSGTATATV